MRDLAVDILDIPGLVVGTWEALHLAPATLAAADLAAHMLAGLAAGTEAEEGGIGNGLNLAGRGLEIYISQIRVTAGIYLSGAIILGHFHRDR